jgi:MMP 1-O-methyltransferase
MIDNIQQQIQIKKDLNILQKQIKDIDGWLTLSEADVLYLLALNFINKGVIVEIGSYKGKSTICLAKGSKKNNSTKIYAIDPHTAEATLDLTEDNPICTYNEFISNIKTAKVDDIIEPIKNTSEGAVKAFDLPVGLLFIDGAHHYEAVKLDFELWSPKVIKGGRIAFHDATNAPGVMKLIKEAVETSANFGEVRYVDSIAYVTKLN